jgi:hypothetical protein
MLRHLLTYVLYTYIQGTYPTYKAAPAGQQTLYEYHVPGDYEDAELTFDPKLAVDLKGLAPFSDPSGRSDTYQVRLRVCVHTHVCVF